MWHGNFGDVSHVSRAGGGGNAINAGTIVSRIDYIFIEAITISWLECDNSNLPIE